MTLVLQEQCPACTGAGMVYDLRWKAWHKLNSGNYSNPSPEPEGPEEYPCSECEGTGKILTEDGKTVAALVATLLQERENAQGLHDMYVADAAARREQCHRDDFDRLQKDLKREQWAREDLERKMHSRR